MRQLSPKSVLIAVLGCAASLLLGGELRGEDPPPTVVDRVSCDEEVARIMRLCVLIPSAKAQAVRYSEETGTLELGGPEAPVRQAKALAEFLQCRQRGEIAGFDGHVVYCFGPRVDAEALFDALTVYLRDGNVFDVHVSLLSPINDEQNMSLVVTGLAASVHLVRAAAEACLTYRSKNSPRDKGPK